MVVDDQGRWTYADADKKEAKSKREEDDEGLDNLDPFEDVSMGVPWVRGHAKETRRRRQLGSR